MKRDELRKIVETQIKKLYAESLDEDMEKRNAVFNYMKKVLHPDHKWRKKRDAAHERGDVAAGRVQGRILKKVFAKLADRSFIDSLVTVHWGKKIGNQTLTAAADTATKPLWTIGKH